TSGPPPGPRARPPPRRPAPRPGTRIDPDHRSPLREFIAMKPTPPLLALALALLSAAAAAAAPARPNVLLVLSDDHSAPHVGCYGNADIRTPNLDRFAAQGMRFDRAYVACPQCVPSR